MEHKEHSSGNSRGGEMNGDSHKEAQNNKELLELYKLHSELADRVSQRREGTNRLYVTLLVGLMVLLGTSLRLSANGVFASFILIWGGVAGILLALSWFIVIRSYRQLNTGKFLALHELESMLAYQFFQREWDLLGEGRDRSQYWKLSVVETSMPIIFSFLFLGLILYSYFTR